MKKLSAQNGFTLIEVIIAVTILSFISLFTARMIQQGVKAKGKIQTEIDRTSALNAALGLMNRDLQQAFNYRDVNIELYNAAQTARKEKVPEAQRATLNPEEYKLKEVKIYTHFLGEKDRLDFTSLNNFRALKNLQQSDQAEIGYYLESCSGRIKKETSSQCLWRRVSPFIDEEIKDGGKATVLLENVKSLQFRYMGPGHEEEWIETWKSKDGEEIMKEKFPVAVEVTLIILDTKFKPAREVAMTVVAALHFPNNKVDEKSEVVN